ncbi:MAG: dehII [Tardiphaga sp.]|nr:dehII [Tardiphaga sp.]
MSKARVSGLPWDLILTSELVESVKPAPKVHQIAPRCLGVLPSENLMVACQKLNLRAAEAQGFRTAFVARPPENGANCPVDTAPDSGFDLNAKDFNELADLLHT